MGEQAEVEIAGFKLGDQINRKWEPLNGFTCDSKDDVFEVMIDDDVDHLIYQPKDIYVEEESIALRSVEIVDCR
ncbi:MAG: DUF5335 family protein [Gammaproteobacteria bacterium]|nr:DUF5335 family protein [Gammaproteobacteria bacterium]